MGSSIVRLGRIHYAILMCSINKRLVWNLVSARYSDPKSPCVFARNESRHAMFIAVAHFGSHVIHFPFRTQAAGINVT